MNGLKWSAHDFVIFFRDKTRVHDLIITRKCPKQGQETIRNDQKMVKKNNCPNKN